MPVKSEQFQIETRADGGIHDITEKVGRALKKTELKEGIVTIFCVGSTYSVSTIEYEPGLLEDFPAAMEKIAPKGIDYAHHETWHDDNGRSHVKATLMGPSLTVPFTDSRLTLGTWQQIVLIEWDTRSRTRDVVLQFLGELCSGCD